MAYSKYTQNVILIIITSIVILSLSRNVHADDFDYGDVFGLSTGIGYTETDTNTGGLAWVNFYMFVFNFSAEYKDYTDYNISNVYTGLGLGKYLQLQYGDGNEGKVYRARTEFNLYQNLSLMIARERYPDNHGLDNTSIGLGLTFE